MKTPPPSVCAVLLTSEENSRLSVEEVVLGALVVVVVLVEEPKAWFDPVIAWRALSRLLSDAYSSRAPPYPARSVPMTQPTLVDEPSQPARFPSKAVASGV